MGNSSSASSIQSYLYNKEDQEQFIISMSSTSPLFSDSLKNSTIVRSQASAVNYFCFFTGGSNRNLKFWQLRNFFVISLQVHNPKIKLFHAIVHTFKGAKFLSTYIDKVAFANMISFMDSASASISRDLYITRILDLYKNNDSLLYSKVYPLHRIRFAEPFLDVAEPTLIGRSAHRYAQDESFSTTSSEHPSRLVVNSEFLEMPSTINEAESILNSVSKSKKKNQKPNSNKLPPNLKDRSFSAWSSVANDTTSNFESTTELNATHKKTIDQTNLGDDSQFSSFVNPLSEPDSANESGLSTMLNSNYSPYDSSVTNRNMSSSSPQISEPGLYESSVSETFKNARKMRSKVRLHKHHNLDSDRHSKNSEMSDFSNSSSVSVSESFFSQSTYMGSESSCRSHKRSNRRRKRNDDDDSYYSIPYSERSVASKAEKIHIFTESEDSKKSTLSSAAPSFVSEAIISSATGKPSRRKRNVGVEIDLRHDVGFTSSSTAYEYEDTDRADNYSSYSSRRSNSSSKRSRSRRKKNESISDDTYDQNDNLNRIRNRRRDISMDAPKSQTETIIDSD